MREPGPSFDPNELALAFARLPVTAWTVPIARDDDVNPGYQMAVLIADHRRKPALDLFAFVLAEFAPVHTAWISRVPAGMKIGPHVDQGPYRERWHVPVLPAGTFNGRPCLPGVSFPVEHWRPHRVDNPTDHDRIHLVIDRDVIANETVAPFQRLGEE